MELSWYYIQGVLTLAGIYMLAVVGLSLLTGFTGLFSFGHAGFMAIGAYTTALFIEKLSLPLFGSLVCGGLSAALVSIVIGQLTLNLKGDYFCIATLGFGETIRLVFDNVQYFGGARGWPSLPIKTDFITVLIVNCCAVLILRSIVRSRLGRNMIAIREEELASELAGIAVFRYKMLSLAISAAYAGVSGGLMATYLGFLQPKMFGLIRSTELTIIVIFGGLGSISGSVIGSLILVCLPELMRSFLNWRLVVYGAAILFIIIARPEGLMGGKEISFRFIGEFVKKMKRTKTGKHGNDR